MMRLVWVAWVLAACVVVLAITRAPAHSWYPHECCSDRDCAEMPEADTPKPLDGGNWLLTTGEIVPRDRVKWSPDGHYHICRWHANNTVLCLFVPPQGS